MKLEVGMYVRTDKGIAKYLGLGIDVLKDDGSNSYNHWKSKHLFDNYIFDEEWGDTLTRIGNIDKIIVGEPSFNIIDLIEVGDYVNGHQVEEIDYEIKEIWCNNEYYYNGVSFKDIRSVVTKEQFEQISYKLGDE